MTRRLLLASVFVTLGCGGPELETDVDVDPDAGAPPDRSTTKADAPRDLPDVASHAAAPCDAPGSWGCAGDHALYCQDGYAGGRWIDRGACAAGQRCASGWGCAPLPRCGDEGLLACVRDDVFACDDAGGWTWKERCPAALACVHGHGCPNEAGVGEQCNLDGGPRCADGMIQRCRAFGIDFEWGPVEACPSGSTCREGEGCVWPDGCQERGDATCDDGETARYCVEGDDGVLDWGEPRACYRGCTPGRGCGDLCQRRGALGACLD